MPGEGGEGGGGADARGAAELAEEARGDDRPDAAHLAAAASRAPARAAPAPRWPRDVGVELEEPRGELPHDEQAGLHDGIGVGQAEVAASSAPPPARQRAATRGVAGSSCSI
jgi:hypothetical protein